MKTSRLAFIDWMKCLGILVIVYGHVADRTIRMLTPPTYPKQLGVAFFLFVAGFSLAGERRPVRRVLFNRLFEVFLFGLPLAVLLSVLTPFFLPGFALSNYLPFLLGANAVFDHFPANPTTWYVGTYQHVLLAWALLLRGRSVRPWMIVVAVAGEVVVRAALGLSAGPFVSYMLLSNWAAVFLLGTYCGQRPEPAPRTGLIPYALGLGLLAVAWPLLASRFEAEGSFPFQRFVVGPRVLDAVVTSAAVSAVYLLFTWLVYEVTRRLPGNGVVRFVARNTVIIFLAHMPLYYALRQGVETWVGSYGLRVVIWFAACCPLLAVVSEGVRRLVRPESLRERVWARLAGEASPAVAEPTPAESLPAVEAGKTG